MVLEVPVEFSTISPEKRLIGRRNKTPPITINERKKARIEFFKIEFIFVKDKPYFSTSRAPCRKKEFISVSNVGKYSFRLWF